MKDQVLKVKNKLLEILHERNMSIYQLAIMSDISEACIRNWYSKRNYSPSLDSLQKIAEALNISIVQLFIDKDDMLYPVDLETKELIDGFIKLDNNKKQLILDLMKSYHKK